MAVKLERSRSFIGALIKLGLHLLCITQLGALWFLVHDMAETFSYDITNSYLAN